MSEFKAIIDLLEEYMTSDQSEATMSKISDALNELAFVPIEISERFYGLFDPMDNLKFRKALILTEFLTIRSPAKLLDMMKEEEFFSSFLCAFSEDLFFSDVLNILSLWREVYKDNQEDIPQVFEHIEGLEAFDIQLPKIYKSQWDYSTPTSRNNPSEPVSPFGFGGSTPRHNIATLLETSKTLARSAKSILEDNLFERMSEDEQKEVLGDIIFRHGILSDDFSSLELTNAVDEIKQTVQKAVETTKKNEKLLVEKFYESITGRKKENPKESDESTTNKKLKEDKQVTGDENAPMTIEEFLAYKTHPCQRGIDCPFNDDEEITKKEDLSKMGKKNIVKCPFWHSENDRRRKPVDRINGVAYNENLCWELKNCNWGESCISCHNYFEKEYHPGNYKSKMCQDQATHISNKYCPYYHSANEKLVYEYSHAKYSKVLEREAPDTAGVPLNNKETEMEEIYGHSDVDLPTFGPKPRPGFIDLESSYPIRPPGTNRIKQMLDQARTTGDVKPQDCKGYLHSKLIVRKNFENPNTLTNLFLRSSCFQGFPFVVQQKKEEREASVEQSK